MPTDTSATSCNTWLVCGAVTKFCVKHFAEQGKEAV